MTDVNMKSGTPGQPRSGLRFFFLKLWAIAMIDQVELITSQHLPWNDILWLRIAAFKCRPSSRCLWYGQNPALALCN